MNHPVLYVFRNYFQGKIFEKEKNVENVGFCMILCLIYFQQSTYERQWQTNFSCTLTKKTIPYSLCGVRNKKQKKNKNRVDATNEMF